MDIDFVKELIPFGVGVIALSPALLFIIRPTWSSPMKFLASFVAAFLVGLTISFSMGELFGELPDAVVAIIVDTSSVYAGSQLAYWLIWRAIKEKREEGIQATSRTGK